MPSMPNVVFVVWDSARVQNTSLHGYDRATTPELEGFVAEDWVHYEQARSPASWTLPAHVSMVTGRYPCEHGVSALNPYADLGRSTLLHALEDAGYHTTLYTNNTYLNAEEFGFAGLFDEVVTSALFESGGELVVSPSLHAKVDRPGDPVGFARQAMESTAPLASLAAGVVHKLGGVDILEDRFRSPTLDPDWWGDDGAGAHVRHFLETLDDREPPFFALFNFLETHAPFRPPPAFRQFLDSPDFTDVSQTPLWQYHVRDDRDDSLQVLRDLYDGCLAYLDAKLRSLVDGLAEVGVLEDTLVVVMGDHGEGFGEDGQCRERCIGHTGGIEEELLHVPLVARFPGGAHGGTAVEDLVSLKDIFHTVVDVADLSVALPDGASLRPDADRPNWVLAERNGLTEGSRTGLEEWGVNVDELDQRIVAYYERAQGQRTKYTFDLGGACEEVHRLAEVGLDRPLDDAKAQAIRDRGRATFDRLDDATTGDDFGTPDIDERTADQLRDLGYR